MAWPASLTKKGLIKHYSLIPLVFFTGAAACWASFYMYRLATKNPDVTWNRSANPEPWQHYKDKQYKFYTSFDHSKIEDPRPKF